MMTSESAVEQRYRKWEIYRMWNYNCYARGEPDDEFSSSGEFIIESDKACRSTVIFEEASVGFDAGMNMAKTLFIILVLGGGAIAFSKDAQVLFRVFFPSPSPPPRLHLLILSGVRPP